MKFCAWRFFAGQAALRGIVMSKPLRDTAAKRVSVVQEIA
jgi:hypothetical protein